MNQSISMFSNLQEAKNLTGDLQESKILQMRVNITAKIEPTVAVTNFVTDGELFAKLVTIYYYVNEHLQILVVEAKDHNNNTIEFTEKLWEYNPRTNTFIHEKYLDGELKVSSEIEHGYGKPGEIAEFSDARKSDETVTTQDTAAGACFFEDPPFGKEPCCKFDDVVYNYCGSYCGYQRDAGGGPSVNQCDACCYYHDTCLAGNGDPCDCHDTLLRCYGNASCPGDTTMGLGIRYKAHFLDGCPL
ncbi:hypothetical protein [Pontibacillus halophilus]|uniref:hypothetical protein n=1 Tax=Pontibacillus halophilus TaxID=516704 RepID=UPI00047C4138|nr:hypothetical protein [Pontibacillus halophilus]